MIAGRLLACAAGLGLAICCARTAAAADRALETPPADTPYWRIKVSIGYHFSAGDYGTSATTEIHYVPFVVSAEVGRWLLQGTIPYLRISGPPGIIEGPNGPIQTNGNADGLGDLLARGSYVLPIRSLLPTDVDWDPWLPFVEIIGLVKFPTASRSQGLGTGEFDFGLENQLTWVIGSLTPFLSAGYRFLGSPPGTHLDNVFVGSVGSQYQILESVSGGLLLDYRQAPSPATGRQLELVPYAAWKLLPPWAIESYVSAGLADGSPAVGVGIQLDYTW